MKGTAIFERGDRIYLVGPVAPFDPGEKEIEEFAFAKALMDQAPNPNILWMQGRYVEADSPNLNRAMWTADELSIKSLTPRFMPITVMHDPRTAVGLIADTTLVTPEANGVPRSRIDNTLAVWRHRFPEVAEEALHNYEQGSLMQSMECIPAYYDCSECGARFPKLPGGAEQANWCAHLKGEQGSAASRTLGNVTFTGTGLIFGTRGAKGAYADAHLEPFQDEVAEFHERAHRDVKHHKPRPKRSTRTMEIDDKRYEELIAAESRTKGLEADLAKAQEAAAKVPDLEKEVEQAAVAQKAAEDTLATEKAAREALEETARSVTLASERVGKLGDGFKAKLPEKVKTKLEEQAKSLSDEAWTERLDELAEMTGVKPDEGKKEGENGNGDGTFSREEVARAGVSGGGGNGGNGGGGAISPERRRSVVAGLVHPKKS